MVRMTAWALLAGATLGLGLWMLASMAPRMNRPRLARRLAPYLQEVSPAARNLLEPTPPGPLAVLDVISRPVTSRLARVVEVGLGGSTALERRLRQSGSRSTVEAYRAQQAVAAVVGALVGVILAALGVRAGVGAQAVVVVGSAIAGVYIRDALLTRAANARLRRLTEELPVILEFLTLSLSAGEGILDALRRVARTGSGELAAELSAVVTAVGTGLPLGETLARLAHDLDLPPLTRCVEQLLSALERGTPLAEVLRAQAQDSRDDAKRRLLEVAGRKEIAMLFPLVFLILPVTIVFAVFPGIVVLQLGF